MSVESELTEELKKSTPLSDCITIAVLIQFVAVRKLIKKPAAQWVSVAGDEVIHSCFAMEGGCSSGRVVFNRDQEGRKTRDPYDLASYDGVS